jgi:hypothetical protein
VDLPAGVVRPVQEVRPAEDVRGHPGPALHGGLRRPVLIGLGPCLLDPVHLGVTDVDDPAAIGVSVWHVKHTAGRPPPRLGATVRAARL